MSEVQVTIGEVVNVHSSVVSLRCVFLKVVWNRRLVKVPFKMYGSQAPRAMSVLISRYCEIVSLSSKGRSVYSALGCGVICKKGSKIRFKGGEDSRVLGLFLDLKCILNFFKYIYYIGGYRSVQLLAGNGYSSFIHQFLVSC